MRASLSFFSFLDRYSSFDCFITITSSHGIHSLIQPYCFFRIFKEVDLLGALNQMTESYPNQAYQHPFII
ncbi:Uncharacterised protein [Mycobacterium tuberculosis]|nr:Uncharacterised protein [Mycobacterium tuberculosis]